MNAALPPRWGWLARRFRGHATRFVRKNFHAVRLAKCSHTLPADDRPMLVVLNHPGWWDPLICAIVSRQFARRAEHFGVMDTVELRRYWGLNRVGFFGIEPDSLAGAKAFLRAGTSILGEPNRVLWVTAQGRFADARERPLNLRAGVARLTERLSAGWVVPLAVEYAFWTERTPEALVRFGAPLPFGAPGIEPALADTLDVLNRLAVRRDPHAFTTLLAGRAGAGGIYDFVRRGAAWARGERFDAAHRRDGSAAIPRAQTGTVD